VADLTEQDMLKGPLKILGAVLFRSAARFLSLLSGPSAWKAIRSGQDLLFWARA